MFEEAASLHQSGRLAEAERLYQTVLKVHDTHFGCLHGLGVLRAQQGRTVEALGLLQRSLEQDPNSAEAHTHVGFVLHTLGRYREAIASFEKAIAIEPDFVEAHFSRGVALQALGSYESSIAAYERALALDPEFVEARYNLGTAFQTVNRHEEAIKQYELALAIRPDYARAHAGLGAAYNDQGNALQALERHDEAIVHYKKALALNADDADAHNNLGLALQHLNRHGEAIESHRKALALRPDFSAAHNNLGRALQAMNRHDEAIAHYRRAITTGAPNAERHANLGLALQEIGRLDEACAEFMRAIELAPKNGRLYRNLADCRRFSADDPQLAAMNELARDLDALSAVDRKQLLFALGKAYADLGEVDRSFGYIVQGNALKRQEISYNEQEMLARFARIRAIFSADLMARRSGIGCASSVPVFVIGMPRSGTTLVEQILASHSKVFGAGELPDLSNAVVRLRVQDGHAFPEIVPLLSDRQLRQIGENYAASISSLAPAAERITDKMPLNFFFAGLISLALPNARIIHVRRDPVDTCFSCFSTLFTGEHRVAYELSELGRYYRAYENLMEHWRRVLPAGAMIEVQYEKVVADLEGEARRLIAHCGLEWEDACLAFDRTERAVRTASVAQVRRPIYRSSVGRWQRYQLHLRPLLDALGSNQV